MKKRFVKDICPPIDELKTLKYQLIEDIQYWDELKRYEKVKHLKAKLNGYEKAIKCLEIDSSSNSTNATQYDTQTIKVLNTTTNETITQTFQEWMMRAMKISETFNTDFEYLKVVK